MPGVLVQAVTMRGAVPMLVTLCFASLLFGSCGSDDAKSSAQIGNYDKSCVGDSDCVFVNIGICECTCGSDSINVKDVPKFEADTKGCGATCGACMPPANEPYCSAGMCDARPKGSGDAGADAPADG